MIKTTGSVGAASCSGGAGATRERDRLFWWKKNANRATA